MADTGDQGIEYAAAVKAAAEAEQRLAEPEPVIEVLVGTELPGPADHLDPNRAVAVGHVELNRGLMGLDHPS